MDIYDDALTGSKTPTTTGQDQASRSSSSSSSSSSQTTNLTTSLSDSQQPTLQKDVEQIVGGISSWWSGFSKKSQESISNARQQIDSQGGLMSIAKKEIARFEDQLAQAQKRAREQSLAGPASTSSIPATSDLPFGLDVAEFEGEQKLDQDPKAESSSQAASQDQRQQPPSSPITAATEVVNSATSFLTRVTSQISNDPRIVNLQRNLASSLSQQQQSPPVSDGEGERGKGTGGEGGTSSNSAVNNVQETLSKLSLTIQSHLPHLDWTESQGLAKKYLEASESFAKDLGKEMKELASEMVRIVPPPPPSDSSGPSSSQAAARGEKGKEAKVAVVEKSKGEEGEGKRSIPTTDGIRSKKFNQGGENQKEEEEEDFAWDDDEIEGSTPNKQRELKMDSQAQAELLIPPAAATPAKGEVGGGVQVENNDSVDVSVIDANEVLGIDREEEENKPSSLSGTKASVEKPKAIRDGDEDDEDSDWE
ncbi:hypothetical protein IE53DRAFT_385374 [Violaceomyces palustris]|uniref:Uncharacterized protein n=1 Tax=Violaceomyces palustris TaxID=1673888 RepID=A0ACD0P2H8_9BASI|nr:hypothetical protein IE53DRAFT_385374 [Violaceomyces palustris]